MKLGVCNVHDGVQVVQLEPEMQMTHNVMRDTEAETSSQSATLHALVIQSKNGSVAQGSKSSFIQESS